MIKVLVVVGTRPEAIKMAPVISSLQKNQLFKPVIVSTGQHKQMLSQVFELFSIKLAYDLKIMSANQSLSDIAIAILKNLGRIIEKEKPALILVHGDTPTAFVAALIGFYHKIPIGHVEAGLRTWDKYNPFPEEMDRQLIDVLSDFYFAPTKISKINLVAEGKPTKNIFVTGNTVIDALLQTSQKEYEFKNKILKQLDFENKRIILLTSHRRESWGKTMEGFFKAISKLAHEFDDIEIVYPVHLNPKVQTAAKKMFVKNKNIFLIDPLDYQDIVKVMKLCYIVVTDSGGLQEEAPTLGKPTLVLRDTTERPEGIAAGTLKLIGTSEKSVYDGIKLLLENKRIYTKMAKAKNPYGDGKAAEKIVQILQKHFS